MTVALKAKPRTSSRTAIALLALVGLDADGSKLPAQENPSIDVRIHDEQYS